MTKVDKKKCMICGGCVSVCPTQALTLTDKELIVDNKKCVNCGACIGVCPVGALEK